MKWQQQERLDLLADGPESHSQEMELVYRRCLQSKPEVRSQSPHSQSLPRVIDQRHQEKHIPHCKPNSDESGKEQASVVHRKNVQSVTHSNQHKRKENYSGNDPVKVAKSKVYQRENNEQPTHGGKKLCPSEITVKSSIDSHKKQDRVTAKPSAAQNSKQDTSQLLVPNVVSKDSSAQRSSSLPKKEKKIEIREKKILPQTVDKMAQETAQIPVRITPRIDGVSRPSGTFIVLQNGPSTNPPILKSKPVELRSSEPPVKRKKTTQEAVATSPGAVMQQSTGKDRQNLDHGGKTGSCRPASSDEAISDDDIFREIPERYSNKTSKMKEKTIAKFKEEQLLLDDAPSIDNQKKYSHKSSGHIKESSHHHSGSHSAPTTGCKVNQAGKNILAKEQSRSNDIFKKDRPKKEPQFDPRSILILAKRDRLMNTYRSDCETFAAVAKQLVNQDPTIEKQVQFALRKSLQRIGERCLEELKKGIAKYDAANAPRKSNPELL
ncbi:uncharacterized protein LOC119978498 isoform X3 [Scyliorhinus canicula]|uniref:uncharacterized protein LOC119978498 isoform X3 n=1 Tax=Scyliorhinus canicula TaxID=7830 RepID=UPI0018F6490D|nr:uncharacterized protein LOC119978498 isoform X3 [Scyliorhinus canicula]